MLFDEDIFILELCLSYILMAKQGKSRKGQQWQSHTCVFIGNTLASAGRPKGYFKLEGVSGSPVWGTCIRPGE